MLTQHSISLQKTLSFLTFSEGKEIEDWAKMGFVTERLLQLSFAILKILRSTR